MKSRLFGFNRPNTRDFVKAAKLASANPFAHHLLSRLAIFIRALIAQPERRFAGRLIRVLPDRLEPVCSVKGAPQRIGLKDIEFQCLVQAAGLVH